MSNKKYISSSLANLLHSLVFSFDLAENTKDYSFGIAPQDKPGNILNELHISKDKLKWYNPTLIKFSLLDLSIDSTSFTFQNGYYYVWNTLGKLLGNEILILQEAIPLLKYHYYIESKNGIYALFEKDNPNKPISLAATDLKYNCYMNSDLYTDSSANEELKTIFHNNQYYFKTLFLVIPLLTSYTLYNESSLNNLGSDYDAILLSSSQGDIELLASDYVIKLNPLKYNISTIVAKYKGKIQNTDYIKFADFDRARFVISDYGRIISHSIHKKLSDSHYLQIRPTVFNVKKRESDYLKKVWIKFTIDTPTDIKNLTANF